MAMIPGTLTGGLWVAVASPLIALSVLAQIMFFVRRSKQPIRGRFRRQSALCWLNLLTFASFTAFVDEFNGDCTLKFILGTAMGFNTVLSVLIRAVHIYSVYEVAQETVAFPRGAYVDVIAPEAQKKRSFFIRHATKIQNFKNQVLVFLLGSGINVGVAGITYVGSGEEDPCSGIGGVIVSGVIGVLYGTLTILLARTMRSVEDGLYLKQELKALGYLAAVTTPIWLLLGILFNDSVGNIAMVTGCFIGIFIVIVFPVYKTYSWETTNKLYQTAFMVTKDGDEVVIEFPQPTKRLEPKLGLRASRKMSRKMSVRFYTMDTILRSDDGFETFRKYLTLEFAHENLMFWDDADKFIEKYNDNRDDLDGIERDGMTLYLRYIKRNAKLSVNIPDPMVKAYEAALDGTIQVDRLLQAVREARTEIHNLLLTDSFPRFRRHKLYRDLAQRIYESVGSNRNLEEQF